MQGKPLQTGFLKGMEYSLGVNQTAVSVRSVVRGSDEIGHESHEADLQAESIDLDHARDRYHRMFWEPVAENQVRTICRLYIDCLADETSFRSL